jgi:hypothetical protein
MRYTLPTLLIAIVPAAIGAYSGAVLLGPYFVGPGRYGNGITIGAVLGGIAGISLGTFLASRHVQTDLSLPGAGKAFRLTIREIGLLCAIACLALGWIVDHELLRTENRLWVDWTIVLGHRLEDHGETLRKRDDIYYVRETNSNTEWPYWSKFRGPLERAKSVQSSATSPPAATDAP